MQQVSHRTNILLLIMLSLAVFMLGNHVINLTNPDEVFYAQSAKEMMQHKTWSVPYLFDQPQFEKPVLTFWLLRVGYILFGVTNFGARFFPSLFAILGVISAYYCAFFCFNDKQKAFWSAFILMTSGLYIGLGRTVFTDMIFTVIILMALTAFLWGYKYPHRWAAGMLLCFIFCAFAALAKTPVGIFIPLKIILVFLFFHKQTNLFWRRASLIGFMLCLFISAPWYIAMIKTYGQTFTHEFFYNDHIRRIFEAEHSSNDTWFFYPGSMVLCMFPWSAVVFVSFFSAIKKLWDREKRAPYIFLFSWIVVTFIMFQIAHSKLVSYIFPLFPALALLAGDFIVDSFQARKRSMAIATSLSWIVFLSIPIGMFIMGSRYPEYLPPRMQLYFFVAIYFLLLGVIFWFMFKKLWKAYWLVAGFQLPFLFFFALWAAPSFDAYVAGKKACDYLLANSSINDTVLCSKFLARGVRFYTDKKVAVIDINGKGYFSPHPIPYLNSDAAVKDFLNAQTTTYCVVTKSAYADLGRITKSAFSMQVVRKIGDEYIIKIQPSLPRISSGKI